MTKNRFLSKRLACLLTTALIASPIVLINSKSVNAAALTLSQNSTNAASGINGATSLALIDTVAMSTFALTLTNTTATAPLDSSSAAYGAITATTGALGVKSTSAAATTMNLTSFISSGASAVTVSNLVTSVEALTVAVSGDITTVGGSLTLESNAVAKVLTVNASGNVSANVTLNDLTLGTTVLNMAGTSKTLTGTVDGASVGEGELKLAGGTLNTVTGVIGGTARIKTLNIDDTALLNNNVSANTIDIAASKTASFKGDITAATAINLNTNATSILNLSGTTAQTVTGSVIGVAAASDGLGAITVSNPAGATFVNAIGAPATQVLSLTTSGTGKVSLSASENFVDKIVIADGTTLELKKTITNNQVVFKTDSTAFDATAITAAIAGTPAFLMPANLINGQSLVLIQSKADPLIATDATGALVGTMTDIVTDLNTGSILRDNALSDYTATATTGLVTITSTDKSAATTAAELGVNTNKATGLLEARNAAAAANTAATDTAAIDALYNVLNAQGGQSATAATNFANQVAPQTDTIAGSTVAAKAVTSGVQNIMSTRLASLRSGDAFSTGVVTGSGMSANSGFIQAFGSTVEQKNKGNEFGYDADTAGFALGVDGKFSDGIVVGISYANSKTDVDGKGTGKAKNDIKTNSGSIYADYTTKDGYVEGSITYGQSDNKGSRVINTGDLNRTYASNYDSEQYSFRLSGGVPINLGAGAFFTPFAGATISQIKTDAYTETSTTADDSLRLRVAQDTVDSQVGTIGIKYHQVIKDGKTTFTPEVKLAVNQEFGDDTITSTNTYQGGGTSFKNSTAIEKTSATAGVGLNISSDNVSFNIGYEADVRDKYLGHSAQAKITAKF